MTAKTIPARFDLFRVPHKGLRKLMFDTAALLGATDFGSPVEAAAAAPAIERMLGLCADHLEHEDRVVMPELQRLAADVHLRLHEGHAEHVQSFAELRVLAARLCAATAAERWSSGERLRQALHLHIARDLQHMAIEETEGMRALWAHRSDEELLALERAIVESIPPARVGEFGAFMLPALSLPERAAVVGSMLARGMPEHVLELVVAPGRAALGPAAWEATLAAARAHAESLRAAA